MVCRFSVFNQVCQAVWPIDSSQTFNSGSRREGGPCTGEQRRPRAEHGRRLQHWRRFWIWLGVERLQQGWGWIWYIRHPGDSCQIFLLPWMWRGLGVCCLRKNLWHKKQYGVEKMFFLFSLRDRRYAFFLNASAGCGNFAPFDNIEKF